MSNKEAYREDLESVMHDVEMLFTLVTTKEATAKAEEILNHARVTIHLMEQGYVVAE